jgi:hypothetical protein
MRTCTIDGCRRKHCARGLCRPHYNRTHGKEPTTRVQCRHCGTPFGARNDELKRGKGKYCSPACYHAAPETRDAKATALRTSWPACRIRIKECRRCAKPFATHGRAMARRVYCSRSCAREAQAVQAGWRNRSCAECGAPLGYRSMVTYCAGCRAKHLKAARRIARHMRRARMRGGEPDRFDPRVIFERDGWRCGICRRRVNRKLQYPHPRSASLDHIVPLAAGGAHVRTNVQCSHLQCNLDKRHTGPGQLLLIG